MKIFICLLFFISSFVARSQTFDRSVMNPGNWVFNSNYNTEWSRLALNGKDIVFDSANYIIICDTSKKTIYFLEAQNRTSDTIAAIQYGVVETWWDDPTQMRRGVFYYRTYQMGTIEYWPGEMVARDWPGEFRKQYLKRLAIKPKPKSIVIKKVNTTIKKSK